MKICLRRTLHYDNRSTGINISQNFLAVWVPEPPIVPCETLRPGYTVVQKHRPAGCGAWPFCQAMWLDAATSPPNGAKFGTLKTSSLFRTSPGWQQQEVCCSVTSVPSRMPYHLAGPSDQVLYQTRHGVPCRPDAVTPGVLGLLDDVVAALEMPPSQNIRSM
ncbi:hypothetical protein E2C01_029377 [Portunus trituberculatus]|uniref:Uncharacterized protein n=1 Tax=Portunus trituberculatus TaxID=210409 RepID=A0A5B7ERQ2_PORTR|nr:hypothetical protein [Portunus trituberculatus]